MEEANKRLKQEIQTIDNLSPGKREIRALVIDDDSLALVIRTRQLKKAGCTLVETVNSAELALTNITEMIKRGVMYDIIASDYNLSPDRKCLNGAQVVALISRIPQCRNTLIWCVTTNPEAMRDALQKELGKDGQAFLDRILFTSKGTVPAFLGKKHSAPECSTGPSIDNEDQDEAWRSSRSVTH